MNEKIQNMFILYEIEYSDYVFENEIINRFKKMLKEEYSFLGIYHEIDQESYRYYFGFILRANQPILYNRVKIFDCGDSKKKRSKIIFNGFGIQDSFYNRSDWSCQRLVSIGLTPDHYTFYPYQKSVIISSDCPNKLFIKSYIEYRQKRTQIPLDLITENKLAELIKYV